MTEKERKEKIAFHRAALKELLATPRSDWHTGFEALLRIETYKYGNSIRLLTEEVLGEEPPRADYVVLIEDKKVEFDKDIFKIFRKHNILEYKNPHDSLNERVIRKIAAYAYLYIGIAEHEGDIKADEVTISIFRAVKNPKLFKAMERSGNLIKGDAPGIYIVKGITDIPFQIVITGELQGEEYAAYRALTDKAAEKDVEHIIIAADREKANNLRDHYRVLIELLALKNPQIFEEIRRNDMDGGDVLMEIMKDRVDEKVNEKERETTVNHLKDIMESFGVTVDKAMDSLKIPQSQRSIYAGLIKK